MTSLKRIRGNPKLQSTQSYFIIVNFPIPNKKYLPIPGGGREGVDEEINTISIPIKKGEELQGRVRRLEIKKAWIPYGNAGNN